MVVDDEEDLREMINIMMIKEGYMTETVDDGQNFLNKIDVFQPDIVTLDVMMPGLTTKKFLKKIMKIAKEEKRSPSNMITYLIDKY